MNINTTPYTAESFDDHIVITMPYVQEFYRQTATLIRQYGATDGKLLDLGCGTGTLENTLRKEFPDLTIIAMDPSTEMLEEAIEIGNLDPNLGNNIDISV